MIRKKQPKKGIVGFSQKAFVFRKDGRFLAMRRTKSAPSNPLKWDLPGGDIEFGEDPQKSILREIKEETGFVVKKATPLDVEAHITSKGSYWITIVYRSNIAGGRLSLSYEHDLYKWVDTKNFLKLRMSKKIRKFGQSLERA